MKKQTERLLAAITADSADAIIWLDNADVIQSWNRGAEIIFGYTPAEIIGKHFEILVPNDLRVGGELEHLNQELASCGFIRNYITQRVAKDGTVLAVELTRTQLRNEQGQAMGSSAILRDVTKRERAQAQIRELNRQLETQVAQRTHELSEANQQLRRRQRELEKANAELERLDELKSEFVSLVSHELRAPLSNISGSLQLLLDEDDANPLTSHQREMIALANDQTERLARLVKGVLNIARIEAGNAALSFQAFDLCVLIQHLLEQWRVCDLEHQWLGPTAANLPSVWGDRDRVEEVLTNLFDNAYKYSNPQGTISVELQVVEDQLVVSISDQGKGIPKQELEKIFDKFYRIERSDARQTYGSGLGLYISIKLIQAMGGTLWAESRVGHGSTFYISLPLAGQSHPPQVSSQISRSLSIAV